MENTIQLPLIKKEVYKIAVPHFVKEIEYWKWGEITLN